MSAVAYRVRVMLRRRWKSSLAVVVVVAATCGLSLTLVAGAARTLNGPDRYVSWLGLSYDTSVTQNDGPPRTEELSKLAAVASIDSATFVFGGLGPGTSAGSSPVDALVFAGTSNAYGGRVVDGRATDPSKPGEFVGSRSFATGSNARVGDTFVLQTITKDQAAASGFDVAAPGGPAIPATLVGIFDDLASLQDNYPVVIFPPALLASGDIGVSGTYSAITLAPGATTADLRAQLDALPSGDVFSISPVELVPGPVRAAVDTQGIGLLILAAIVSAATIVVAGQMLGREVRLSDIQRSALRTMGMTPRQLTLESLGRAAAPVLTGAVIAAVGAIAFSGLFPVGFARRAEPQPGIRFDPFVHVVGPVVLVGALMGWLYAGLLRRERRSERHIVERKERLTPWMRPPQAATALRISFSHHPADVGSPRTQVAGLLAVLVLAIAASTFGANVTRLIDNPARYGGTELGVGSGGGEIPQQIRDQLATDNDVAALTLYGAVTVSVGSESLGIVGSQAVVGTTVPPILTGRLPVADDEVALGAVAASRLGVGLDDDLGVEAATGPETLRVTGIAVIPGVEGVDGVGEGGIVTFTGLQRLDSSAALSFGAVTLRSGAPANTAERLSTLTGVAVGPSDPPADIVSLGRVRSLPGLLVVVLMVLAVLGLAHLLIQSARQRRRDMAILRALGATRRWVTQVVHWQATIVTLLVWVVAVPLGFIMGRSAFSVVADRIGVPTNAFLPVVSLGVVFAALVVAANVAAAVPSRRVRRLPTAGFLNQE